MRRDHTTTPFDLQAEEADDVTREFWGTSRGWTPRDHHTGDRNAVGSPSSEPARQSRYDDTTGSLRALRDGFRAFRPQRMPRHITGQVERTRQHRIVGGATHDASIAADRQTSAPRRPAPAEATLGQLAAGWVADEPHDDYDDLPTAPHAVERRLRVDDRDLVPLSPVQPLAERLGLSAVDPLLLRIGTMVLVAVMLVPVALALRPAADDVIEGGPVAAVTALAVDETTASDLEAAGLAAGVFDPAAVDPVSNQHSSTTAVAESSDTDTAATSAVTQPTATQVVTTGSGTVAGGSVGDVAQDLPASGGQAATVSEAAERQELDCPSTYVAGAGDSWYRIADEADVTPSALLDQNLASLDSVIFPGDDICLPQGAKMPTQPVVTTQPPATTSPAPATTTPPTTQPAPAPASTAEVQRLIREIWPDELEERALEIAWRESNYKASAYNGWCCYGVFQIYWTVHRSWLDDYGITSSNDLLDARKNIEAAYGMYQRSGGWGPWGG